MVILPFLEGFSCFLTIVFIIFSTLFILQGFTTVTVQYHELISL